MKAVRLSVVIAPYDVRVTDSCSVLGLPKETLDGHRVSGQSGTQNFHRGDATVRVFSSIDSRCATLTDVPREVVSGDGPTDQVVCVHGVAKLVNPTGRSKLACRNNQAERLTPLLCQH